MATKQISKTTKPSTAVAVKKPSDLAVPTDIDFGADAGDGMKGIDADSVAIPFLAVLQKMSPQCDPDSAEYMPDAKAGMFINTVTKEVFDGKEGVLIVPCNYMRKFLRWTPREAGGGFKGEMSPEEAAQQRAEGRLVEQDNRLYVPDENGNVNPKKSDKVSDTRVHYVLILNQNNGMAQQAVMSLASTQIKKSKRLNSLIRGVLLKRPDGSEMNPASYASVFRVTSVPESNDQGSWSGVEFERVGFVQDSATYQLAKAFCKLVDGGRATVNFASADLDEGGGERERF